MLEAILEAEIAENNLPRPEREFKFHPRRRWRFDFAWPQYKKAVEIEGAVWTQGRHTRGAGFIGDCEKYNEAALLGWTVLRLPEPWVKSRKAMEYVTRLLEGSNGDL